MPTREGMGMNFAVLSRISLLSGALVLVSPPAMAGGGQEENVSNLTGVTWRWERTLMNDDTVISPEDPSLYTIMFHDDGTVSARVDCNQMGGTYKLEGASISIDLTHGTRAMCPPESLDVEFQGQINDVRQLVFAETKLHFYLAYHRGTMRFGR